MMVRWDPYRDIDALQRNINRLFGDSASTRHSGREGSEAVWMPPVNTYEDKEGFTLTCDLPGLGQKDVRLNLDKDTLTISGTRRIEFEDKRENYQRIESAFGSFSRSFTIPATVDAEKISAHMENGVLSVRLPKREESKPKQIEVRIK
jgi:HSP20 family protein